LDDFIARTAEMGATNARDLAKLVQAAWVYQPSIGMENLYRRCLSNRKRSIPRTEMYFTAAVPAFTKTGSLGFRFFLQDTGVILEGNGDKLIAAFSHASAGWRLPQYHCDTVLGEVGFLILELLGIERPSSPDRTPFGTTLLLGDT